ncbi:MAG TPA: hypothetical protein DIU15_02695 [Deltaproteobacteria bacterium]|nr:hypothetical protein [Deltaproteobacteria bacterium]
MRERGLVVKEDILMFLGLITAVVVLGYAMQSFHTYINGDWRQVAECRQSYWVCTSSFDGSPIRQGGKTPVFSSTSRACDQYPAYESARRRAMFDCGSSRSVRQGSCRESETRCSLPNRVY